MSKNILYIAEIVTKVGVYCVKAALPALKNEYKADLVIANADGASGGFGLGKSHSIYLHKLGIDIITSGDQIYNKKDIQEHLPSAYHLLRPSNFPRTTPGRGWRTYTLGDRSRDVHRSNKIVVISLLGQVGLNRIHPSNPYILLPSIVEHAKKDTDIIILDFHAVVSAEKAAMQLYADSKVSALIGSGTRAQTSDARILPGGTAVIADSGRSGSIQSVNGYDPKFEIEQRIFGKPVRSAENWNGLEVQGVFLQISDDGMAKHIEAFRRPVKTPKNEESRARPQRKNENGMS